MEQTMKRKTGGYVPSDAEYGKNFQERRIIWQDKMRADEVRREELFTQLGSKKVSCHAAGIMEQELYILCASIEFRYELSNKRGESDAWRSDKYAPRSQFTL